MAPIGTQIPWADLTRLEEHVNEILKYTLDVMSLWEQRHVVQPDWEYSSDRSAEERRAYYALEAEVKSLRDLLDDIKHDYKLGKVAP